MIRNVANRYGSEFANDTWPHFAVSQTFRNYIDLENYKNINVSVDGKVLGWNILSGWPWTGVSGYSQPEMQFSVGGYIRDKSMLGRVLFIGIIIYSDNIYAYKPYYGIDQFGQGFYKDDVTLSGGPLVTTNFKTIRFDLISLIDRALITANIRDGNGVLKTHNNYVLANFGVGYEGMGWFDGGVEIKNLSMMAVNNLPSATPTIVQPTATIGSKRVGDANGDGKVDLVDFGIWKNEYLGKLMTITADFNKSGVIDLVDFGVWKKTYLNL